MKNKELIEEYVAGTKYANACNHIGYKGDTLINYSTVICTIDRTNKTARVNARKYSVSTSKIQGMLAYELSRCGFKVEEYEGEPCSYWNYGYMGAGNLTKADL